MSVSLRGIDLGHMGLDLSLLANRPENVGIRYECPALAYIVETPDGRILWETGISDRATEEWLPEWQEVVDLSAVTPDCHLERRLAALGLGPDDFRYVVLGHLHTDHAGGLRLFQDAGVDIVLHEDEYAFVQGMEQEQGDFFSRMDWAFLGDREPTLVSGRETRLTQHISLVHLPGHTPGQMGMRIDLPHTGTVLLTSDAIYHHHNYVHPGTEPQIYWDIEMWRRSVETIRQVAKETDAWLFPGHDGTGIAHFQGEHELKSIEFSAGHSYE
jgi:N-acyl homoserine lactone hydrolase